MLTELIMPACLVSLILFPPFLRLWRLVYNSPASLCKSSQNPSPTRSWCFLSVDNGKAETSSLKGLDIIWGVTQKPHSGTTPADELNFGGGIVKTFPRILQPKPAGEDSRLRISSDLNSIYPVLSSRGSRATGLSLPIVSEALPPPNVYQPRAAVSFPKFLLLPGS